MALEQWQAEQARMTTCSTLEDAFYVVLDNVGVTLEHVTQDTLFVEVGGSSLLAVTAAEWMTSYDASISATDVVQFLLSKPIKDIPALLAQHQDLRPPEDGRHKQRKSETQKQKQKQEENSKAEAEEKEKETESSDKQQALSTRSSPALADVPVCVASLGSEVSYRWHRSSSACCAISLCTPAHSSEEAESWMFNCGKCLDASPLVISTSYDDRGGLSMSAIALIGSHSGLFVCLDVYDGTALWTTRLPSRIEASAACSRYDSGMSHC